MARQHGWMRRHIEHRRNTIASYLFSSPVHVQPLSTVVHQPKPNWCKMRARTGRTNHACPRIGAKPRSAVISKVVESKVAMRVRDAAENIQDKSGVSMGPISLSFADDSQVDDATDAELKEKMLEEKKTIESLSNTTTKEWREKYEKDGLVDLWVEEEFNSGSRLKGGRVEFNGGTYGQLTGEGPSLGLAPVHHVTIDDQRNGQMVEVDIPEDRYVLWEAEDAGLELPFACRMGCCTACAVKVQSGSVWQPEALGLSKGLKEKGYALMCVGYPLEDTVLQTVEEDEMYETQFGKPFAELAVDKNSIFVERDDFALELAEMDE